MRRKLGSFHPDDFGDDESTQERKKSKSKSTKSKSQSPSSLSSPSTNFNLPKALKDSDYSGDETAEIYVPEIVPPNLDRLRVRLSTGVNSLPKGATVCALVDRGLEILFLKGPVQSYMRLGRLVLEDERLDHDTFVALYNEVHGWNFQVPSLFRMKRIQVRCPEFWKAKILEVSHELGLSFSTVSCVCLMAAMAEQPTVHSGHQKLLAEPMDAFSEQLKIKAVRAEMLLVQIRGSVL